MKTAITILSIALFITIAWVVFLQIQVKRISDKLNPPAAGSGGRAANGTQPVDNPNRIVWGNDAYDKVLNNANGQRKIEIVV